MVSLNFISSSREEKTSSFITGLFPLPLYPLISSFDNQNMKADSSKHGKKMDELGCRNSSVDSSAPSILPPQVQVLSTPSTLLSFIVNFVLYFLFYCEKNERKLNEGQVWPKKEDSQICDWPVRLRPNVKPFLL